MVWITLSFAGQIPKFFLIQLTAVNHPAQENPPEGEQDEDAERSPSPLPEPDALDEKVDNSLSLFSPPHEGQGIWS